MKFHIWCNGDPSVGIPGSQCVLDYPELSDDVNNDQEHIDLQERIDFIKNELRSCFIGIFDDRRTFVMTDKEYEEYTREDDT